MLNSLDADVEDNDEQLRNMLKSRIETKLAELTSRSDLPLLAFYDDLKTNR